MKGDRGSVLILVLIVLVSVSVLGTSLLRIVSMQYKVSDIQVQTQSAHLYAEKVIDEYIQHINETLFYEYEKSVQGGYDKIKELFEEEINVQFEREKGFFIEKRWIEFYLLDQAYRSIIDSYYNLKEVFGKTEIIYEIETPGPNGEKVQVLIKPYIKGVDSYAYAGIDTQLLMDHRESFYAWNEEVINEVTMQKYYNKITDDKGELLYNMALKTFLTIFRDGEKTIVYEEEFLTYLKFKEISIGDFEIKEKYKWDDKPQGVFRDVMVCGGDIYLGEGSELDIFGTASLGGEIINDGGRLNIWEEQQGSKENEWIQLDLSYFVEDVEWEVGQPIMVITEGIGQVHVRDFYVDEEPVPTIIVSKVPLYIRGDQGDYFRGIIISEDVIVFEENVDIRGGIYSASERGYSMSLNPLANVRITYQPDIIWEVENSNAIIYREILNGLGLIDTEKKTLQQLLDSQYEGRSVRLKPELNIYLPNSMYQLEAVYTHTNK